MTRGRVAHLERELEALRTENTIRDLNAQADKWLAFCRALDEGRIAVILEGASDSIDGDVIVTDIDEVLEYIKETKI